jgi:metal-responsive CopG/Arc/MetJ family transcriptional regulator
MKNRTERVAISLPAGLLEEAELERGRTGESRSQFVRRALEALLRAERQREAVERYIDGYERLPETAEEITGAQDLASKVIAGEPWD